MRIELTEDQVRHVVLSELKRQSALIRREAGFISGKKKIKSSEKEELEKLQDISAAIDTVIETYRFVL